MGIFLLWIILSLFVGAVGSSRTLGFWASFFVALLLSPLIGFIIVLLSKNKEEEKYKAEILETQKEQEEKLRTIASKKHFRSITDEINELKKLLDEGVINEDEFQKAKAKIME